MTDWQWLGGALIAIVFALLFIFGPRIKEYFEIDE